MKIRVYSACFVISFCLMSFSLGHAAEAIKLTYANYFPPTHKIGTLGGQFCDEINKRANGKMQITYHPAGTLATGPKVFNAVVQGVADIGLSAISYNRGRFPVTEALDLPHGFPSGWVSGQVENDFYNKFKPKEWDSVHVLYFHGSGPFLLQTLKKPVKSLEDLKGLKIRAVGGMVDALKYLGATPMPVEMADMYESLRRGVIDGVFGPFEQLKGWKTGELIKYVTTSWKVGVSAVFYVAMNKDKWNSLSPDLKKIFDEVSAEYKEKFLLLWNETDTEGADFLKSQGGQVIPLTDAESARWIEAVQPVVTSYKKSMVSAGHSDKEIDSYISYIKERIEYWRKIEKEKGIPRPF